ncbi:MAG: hypothetical protein HY918_01870 [Candidatus Doudnabacteria bacterium]|nr:hypothetical protein [Candidatus Doudnabacteria bacterium]
MKKILLLSAVALLPFFASAATLNNTFTVSNYFPSQGSTVTVTSTCGSLGANSNVSFALSQNGNNTQLSNNLSTDSSGAFSGSISLPSSYNAGQATIIASCSRSGDVINSPVLTFASPVSSSFNLPSSPPSVGGLYNLSGACGNSNGGGSVQINLNKAGSNYSLNNVNLNSTGNFTASVIVPNGISTGPATFNAVCSNGNTFSSSVNLDPVAVNSFEFSANPLLNANSYISGVCNNVSSNANGAVNFSYMRSGGPTMLTSSNNQTNSNGAFSSTVFLPGSMGNDPITLIVTCPNGSTFSNVVMLGAATAVTNPVNTTPVGGVNAGSGPSNSNSNILFGLTTLLAAGMLAWFAVRGKNSYVKN